MSVCGLFVILVKPQKSYTFSIGHGNLHKKFQPYIIILRILSFPPTPIYDDYRHDLKNIIKEQLRSYQSFHLFSDI